MISEDALLNDDMVSQSIQSLHSVKRHRLLKCNSCGEKSFVGIQACSHTRTHTHTHTKLSLDSHIGSSVQNQS